MTLSQGSGAGNLSSAVVAAVEFEVEVEHWRDPLDPQDDDDEEEVRRNWLSLVRRILLFVRMRSSVSGSVAVLGLFCDFGVVGGILGWLLSVPAEGDFDWRVGLMSVDATVLRFSFCWSCFFVLGAMIWSQQCEVRNIWEVRNDGEGWFWTVVLIGIEQMANNRPLSTRQKRTEAADTRYETQNPPAPALV